MPRATIALGRSPTRLCALEGDAAAVGRGSSPVTALKNVVLPAPLGPISPMMAPRGTTRSTSLSAIDAAELLGDAARPRASARRRRRGAGATRSRSQPGMASTRGGGAGSATTGSSIVGRRPTGRTRRPSRPWGRSSMTRTRPRPKKNQRHSVRSIDTSAGTPSGAARSSGRSVVICVRSDAVEDRDEHRAQHHAAAGCRRRRARPCTAA